MHRSWMKGVVCAGLGLAGIAPASPLHAALQKTLIASGVSQPVLAVSPPGDTNRLFIVQKAGRIAVVENDALLPTAFLDIQARVRVTFNEMGLLGLAFHPDYDANGYFYVNYTSEPDGRTVVSRFTVSGNPNVADTTEHVVIEIPQSSVNHNGGMLAFGPLDGYLYIGMGDGGGAGDPGNRAQNPDSLLGKLLRIDVDVDSTYAIPPDNPFVVPDTARHEIWALGLRNPWRFCFDRLTGDLYIADVGQGSIEEIDFEAAGGPGGLNFGWRLKEGTSCYNPPSNCDPGGVLVDPIQEYPHSNGRCSITGGFVYRGCRAPEIYGHYFYGDYCTGEIWSFTYDGATQSDSTDHTSELGLGGFDLSGFGEDGRGELYIMGLSSASVWRIESTTPADTCGDTSCPIALTGDVDVSGSITSADIIYLVNTVFKGGAAPLPVPESGDANCSGTLTSADIIYLVGFIFQGGEAPCDGCTLL